MLNESLKSFSRITLKVIFFLLGIMNLWFRSSEVYTCRHRSLTVCCLSRRRALIGRILKTTKNSTNQRASTRQTTDGQWSVSASVNFFQAYLLSGICIFNLKKLYKTLNRSSIINQPNGKCWTKFIPGLSILPIFFLSAPKSKLFCIFQAFVTIWGVAE